MFSRFVLVLTLLSSTVFADNSATRDSLIKLPGSGGTVSKDSSQVGVEGNQGVVKFQVALPELPGRGQIKGGLSLSYQQNLGGEGSGLGAGFTLGVPSIERRTDRGTSMRGLPFENGDFSLNGKHLIFVRKNDDGSIEFTLESATEPVTIIWTEGRAEYLVQDRFKSFENFVLRNTFEVRYPDGRREIYSGDASAAEGDFGNDIPFTYRWPLVLDLKPLRGNMYDGVIYRYLKSGGRSYLTEVSFAGGASRYKLDLADKPEGFSRPVSYMATFPQQDAALYTKFEALFLGEVRQQWCLAYQLYNPMKHSFHIFTHEDCEAHARQDLQDRVETDSLSTQSMLRALYRFGHDGKARDTSIYFSYSDWVKQDLDSDRSIVYDTSVAPEIMSQLQDDDVTLADVNQDSLVDLVLTQNGRTSILAGAGSLENSFIDQRPWDLPGTMAGPDFRQSEFQFGDFNGDSFVDILRFTGNNEDTLDVYFGDGRGNYNLQGSTVQILNPFSGLAITRSSVQSRVGQFIDLNADGKTDFVGTFDYAGKPNLFLCMNTFDQGRVDFACSVGPFPADPAPTYPLANSSFKLSDINGDHLPDLIAFLDGTSLRYCVYPNNGRPDRPDASLFSVENGDSECQSRGWLFIMDEVQSSGGLDFRNFWWIDVNGDGIADLVQVEPESRQSLKMWLGLGDGKLAPSARNLTLERPIDIGQNQNDGDVKIADIDADGQAEILLFRQSGSSPVRILDFNRRGTEQMPRSNLLTTLEYESGLRYDFRYATSADEFIRDQQAHAFSVLDREPRPLHYPAVVLKQMTVSELDSKGQMSGTEVTEYIYHDPFYDSEDRRFQGFEQVEAIHYGDESTEGTSLVRSIYYSGLQGTQRHLMGIMREESIFELTPHGSYQKSLKDSENLKLQSALLHSLSTYARNQDLPCQDSSRHGDGVTCKLQKRTQREFAAIPREIPGAFFLRDNNEKTEVFSVAVTETPTSCQLTGRVIDSSHQIVARSTHYYEDGTNLPKEIITRQEAMDAPLDVQFPARTHRTVLTYVPTLKEYGIGNLVDTLEQHVWQEGEGEERLQQKLKNTYYDNGFLHAVTTITPSVMKDVPDELNALWKPERVLTVSYVYDDFGNVKERRRSLGDLEKVHYSEDGLFAQHLEDVHGFITDIEYNAKGYVKKVTDPRGRVSELGYDSLGRTIFYQSEGGQLEEYHYKLASRTRPTMIMTRKQVKRRIDEAPEWAYALRAYDARGQELASFDENEYGDGAVGVRVLGLKEYNRKGNVIAESTPFQTAVPSILDLFESGFDKRGESLAPITDLSGNERSKTRFTYDFLSRMVSNLSPIGTLSRMQYFAWGELNTTSYRKSRKSSDTVESCEVKVARGEEIHLLVDELGYQHRSTYDGSGHLRSILLAGEKHPRVTSYDGSGLIEYQKIPGIKSEYHLYDALGRKKGSFIYDKDGAFQHSQETEYDADSRPLVVKLDSKESIRYRYDSYESSEESAAKAIALDFLPAPKGLLTSITKKDPNGLLDYEQLLVYDRSGQVLGRRATVKDLHDSKNSQVFVETYQYGPDGTLLYKDDPFGVSSRLRMNRNLSMSGADLRLPWAPDVWEPVIEQMRYNPKGQIQGVEYRNNIETRIGYEPQTLLMNSIKSYREGRLELQELSLDFDGLGNVVEIDDQLASSHWGRLNRSAKFKYDLRQQLIQASYPRMDKEHGFDQLADQLYSYDYSGSGGFVKNSELSNQNWRTALYEGTTEETSIIPQGPADHVLVYDSLGQLVGNGKLLDAVYDAAGQLICAETAAHTIYYGYSHDSRRLYKKVQDREGQGACRSTAVSRDGQLSLYPMNDVIVEPSGKQSFVMAGANRLARIEHAGETSKAGQWFFYLKDHLQSSDLIIAADGTPVEQMAYKPYGDELNPGLSYKWREHLATNAKGKTPLERTHHRYTGHYLDDDTGLYYAGARYYDSKTGRFASPDPLYVSNPENCAANVISCNLYAYAANNPMSKIDPTGLAEQRWYERAVSYVPVVGSTIDAVRSGYDAYQDIKTGNYRSAMMNGGLALLNATSAVMEAGSLGTGSLVKNVVKETIKGVALGVKREGVEALGEAIGGEKGRLVAGMANLMAGSVKLSKNTNTMRIHANGATPASGSQVRDKWSREPKSIQDKMTLEAAKRGEGAKIMEGLKDPKYKGMDKMEYATKSANDRDSVVHYVRDPNTDELMDFKFKKHSIEGRGKWESTREPNVSPFQE